MDDNDNDEHFISLSNLLAQPILLPTSDAESSASSKSESGSSSQRSPGRRSPSRSSGRSSGSETSSPRDYAHESLYKTELCRTWEVAHSCQYGMASSFR